MRVDDNKLMPPSRDEMKHSTLNQGNGFPAFIEKEDRRCPRLTSSVVVTRVEPRHQFLQVRAIRAFRLRPPHLTAEAGRKRTCRQRRQVLG